MPRRHHALVQPLYQVSCFEPAMKQIQSDLKKLHDDLLPRPAISLGFTKQQHAVLLSKLCSDPQLVLYWIQKEILSGWRRWGGIAELPSAAMLAKLQTAHEHSAFVQTALLEPLHPVRQKLMRFLVESLVVEELLAFWRRGVQMPPGEVSVRYLRKWRFLPQSSSKSGHLSEIMQKASAQKAWSRAFRARWNLRWGNSADTRMCPEELRGRRAAILLRWLRWARSNVPATRPVVVVNMDETCLTNIKPRKRCLLPGADHASAKRVRAAVSYGGPRTTLLAAICDNVALQKVLPQWRLPRTGKAKAFQAPTTAVYQEAGEPLYTSYTTGSWLTQATMVPWLTSLRRAIHSVQPDAHIVLCLDVCSVHTSERVMIHARDLGIRLVFIPASLTWLLQPLDTHIFVIFKRLLRKYMFDALAVKGTSTLSHRDMIRLHSRAIRQTFVEQDFRSRLEGAGFSGDGALLRGPLASIVNGLDLAGRPPTVSELAEVMNVSADRAASKLPLLLWVPRAAPGDAPAVPAPGLVPVLPPYVPRLVRLLPPRPRVAGVRLPGLRVVRPMGIVTRSMTAAERSSGLSSQPEAR